MTDQQRLAEIVWAVKMLFLWRWRLGYWDLDAFRAAVKLRKSAAERGFTPGGSDGK